MIFQPKEGRIVGPWPSCEKGGDHARIGLDLLAEFGNVNVFGRCPQCGHMVTLNPANDRKTVTASLEPAIRL